jgi:hypothetical protein
MSLEKDIEKMTQKIKGVKRRFRIEGGRYGGETTVGTVSEEFVEHCAGMDQDELVEYVLSCDEWNEEERDDSLPGLETTAWYETDDFEHLNHCYSDSEWTVYEVPADGSDDGSWDNVVWEGEARHLYGRECYHTDANEEEKPEDMEGIVPILAFHSSEKGSFASYFLDLEGEEFDPEKLAFSTVEMNLAEIVENVYYNKQDLEANYDWNDTTGKAYYASVGYMNTKWHDSADQYTDEYLEENGYWDE